MGRELYVTRCVWIGMSETLRRECVAKKVVKGKGVCEVENNSVSVLPLATKGVLGDTICVRGKVEDPPI